ncbi:hypothetical protein DCD74_08450 [Lysobacter oculi]|uniref:Glycosyl transferase family 1 n=1 Tax=Solilutibacter oculi TaxID=2698682 RepID=A0A344J6Q4_9GAMM|nr:glycosyltransferase [Lysobacter oculi]AXA84714.1 hypothetical protein DCD74_08450 [Lysobacter oculi]
MLSFSIVINTLNRGHLLGNTLSSFQWLEYEGDFEVVVVNGPSTDNSQEVVESWGGKIRWGRCPVANLSVSRNIGICMAQGDIVAFIDDDAIPEPEWLHQLARAYDHPDIAGAGGLVYDQTGYTYQYEYSTGNRLANANWHATKSAEQLCFPGSWEFPYLQGTNASFRRSALLEVGGFDEEIEYYLDETELCCRLIDAGYVIRQLPDAYVHHKFAPSHMRDNNRVTKYNYPVIKNKIYFALKHGRGHESLQAIMEDNLAFSKARENDIRFHVEGGRLEPDHLEVFADENRRAWDRGMVRGMSGEHEYITAEKLERWAGEFNPFRTRLSSEPLNVVLVSKDFPPEHGGGVATFMKDLAEALAAEGNFVHVITQSSDINRVDFENGVWVHRMLVAEHELPPEAARLGVPQHIWNWSATALVEARRIATHREIDVVEAPIWDCEGIAFIVEKRWPLVVSLQTTLSFWLDTHQTQRDDENWMNSFGRPMLALEQYVMQGADMVRSISAAIRQEIEHRYDFKFDDENVSLLPLGMPDVQRGKNPSRRKESAPPKVLFVGRLEARKGIDVLLEAATHLERQGVAFQLDVVGDDTLVKDCGGTYRADFDAHAPDSLKKKVSFAGRVSAQGLLDAYADCDIFVAPSRFESFGLVFLEAMRVEKPVIGTCAGGMPEIIKHQETGFTVPADDSQALADALKSLLRDAKLREKMGRAGRQHFLKTFTDRQMALGSLPMYRRAMMKSRVAPGVER